MAFLDGSSCTVAVSHMSLLDLYHGVRVRGFEAGQESKGGGISLPPVSVTVEVCVFYKQRSFFYCFIVLAAVPQPDVPGVGEQPAVSPLCCTEGMWPSN